MTSIFIESLLVCVSDFMNSGSDGQEGREREDEHLERLDVLWFKLDSTEKSCMKYGLLEKLWKSSLLEAV